MTETDENKDENQTQTTTDQITSINIYALWRSSEREKFKLQAIFNSEAKFDFECLARLSDGKAHDRYPCVYRLNLNLIRNNDEHIAIKYKKVLYPVEEYQLRLSEQGYLYSSHNKEPTSRVIRDIKSPHHFLFNVFFPQPAPGECVSFWKTLCLFGYYLIDTDQQEIFELFIEQFCLFMHENSIHLTKSNFLDFVKTTYGYFSNKEDLLNSPFTIINLLRMIGILPLEKTTFIVNDDNARRLSHIILSKMSEQLILIFEKLDTEKSLLFNAGLAVVMSVEILNNDSHDDSIDLLNQIPNDNHQRDQIASSLFELFMELKIPIVRTNWTDLLALIDSKELKFNCLDLTTNIYQIISCLEHIVLDEINDKIEGEIKHIFEEKLRNNNLNFNLNDILNILHYLEKQPSSEQILLIQSVIQSSDELSRQILRYLKNSNIDIVHLEVLRDLFNHSNPYLLKDLNKTEYLIDKLHGREKRSYEFYTLWFECFLCETHYGQTEDEYQQFKSHLNEWSKQFQYNLDLLERMAMKLNILVEKLQAVVQTRKHDRRLEYFIENIIDICFKRNSIYDIIGLIGPYLKNAMLINAFVNKFFKEYINRNKHVLKLIRDYNNPLRFLLDLYQRQSQLSNDLLFILITKCSEEMQPDNDELLRHSFIDPARDTCTYVILFNDAFTKLPVRQHVLAGLAALWTKWEGQQLTYAEISRKRNYDPDQKGCFDKIWDTVSKYNGKQYQVAVLFDSAHKDMMEKTRIKEKITACLNEYCQQASDKNDYIKHLDILNQQMERAVIGAIQISPKLKELISIVDRIYPFLNSNAWIHYYTKHVHEKENFIDEQKHLEPVGIDDNQDQQWNDLYGNNENDIEINVVGPATTVEAVPLPMQTKYTCLETLNQAMTILNYFQIQLQTVCAQWNTKSIKEIFNIFPDVQSAEFDLHNLKSLILPEIVPNLLGILTFWKEKIHLQHICLGLKNLLNYLNLPLDENSKHIISIFDQLLTIDEETTGEQCFTSYQQYINTCTENYSTQILNLWSQYYLSHDVIDFLNGLTATQMNNLLEAVNDWDDTLISTKTVLDFAALKTFLDQVHLMIKGTQRGPNISVLDHIATCYINVCKAKEFQQITELFPMCCASLQAIQRLFLELTNRGQSKRQRIIDVMKKSTIIFEQNLSNKQQFNVHLHPQNLTFADLSELRDRARLTEYSDDNKFRRETELEGDQLQQFIMFVNTIEAILETFSSLYITGYPKLTDLYLKLTFTSIDGKFHELEQLCTDCQENLEIWETNLCNMYVKHPELTYFFCEQFREIERTLYNHDETSNGFHMLKYIGFEPNQLRQQLLTLETELENPLDYVENLGRHLVAQEIDRQENAFGKKVWLIETSDDGIVQAFFSLFHRTKTPARVHRLFYCTERTNWTEIRAFIYRCFFSGTLQILIRPHLLSTDIQDRIAPLLRQFIERHPTHSFHLGVISTSIVQNIQLINALKTLNIVITLRDQDLLDKADMSNQLKAMLRHCTLVTSRLAGLGKTSWIEEQCRRMTKALIKFPIGGDIYADKLAERLASHTKDFNTSALHIIIGPVDNIRKLDEILYCLTLFHSFRFDQLAISLPADTPIFIELDSSPGAIEQKNLTICQYIEFIHHIEQIQWNEIYHNLSETQFVVNYLDAIKTGSIVKSEINDENLRAIDVNNCLQLLQAQFLLKKTPEFITWTQLKIFISVYYSLFQGFSQCAHFRVEDLPNSQLRIDILQALLRSSDQFTSLSVEKVRTQQRATATLQENMQIQPITLNDTVVRWETTQPFTVVFDDDTFPIFVYKTIKDVPQTLIDLFRTARQAATAALGSNLEEFSDQNMFPDHNRLSHVQFFIKLASLSKKFLNKAICSQCFRQYPYNTANCIYCQTNTPLRQPVSSEYEDIITHQSCIATLLENQYVLTPDNYIKMLLVFLRVQSGLPVLIMGETGCGKTALIHFLCQIILDDELEIFPIHAGINAEKILEKMSKFIDRANELSYENKRLWVFFDEFNTTHSIGLIKEITCERRLLGRELPRNMVFLGACNPRRFKPDQALFDNNIGIKKARYDVQQLHAMIGGERLLYTVVPLPETMLEYVWDYGFLDRDTEKKYIGAKLKTCSQLAAHAGWLNAIIVLISRSHAYIRSIEDVSSVSLRDVTRYCRLFNWYYMAIIERTKNDNQSNNALRRAAITTLLLCYYFRLKSLKHKQDYIDMVETALLEMSRDQRGQRGFVTRWLNEEEIDIINRMELPPGTAKNRALLENIFVLVACIVNRIPLIMCGKPGCSKTSAVQIVISNLKGKKSHNIFLQTLPELIAVSYQGSQNCTSESIEKVFERANKYLIAQKDSSLLPVIVFDEIGLAELSPHNPLKVLHAELEVETCKYGFVGISNWRLDASKMNRTLYLACPDPDNEDLKTTSTVIAQSMLGEIEAARLSKEILPSLAVAYYELFSYLKTKQKIEYYFGLRDFYSLIKGFVREIQNNPNIDPYLVIRRQLTINFDGIVDGSEFMWNTFCKTLKREELVYQYQSPNLKQLLNQNLTQRSAGRYLMLIAENESAIDYVERYIHAIPNRRTQTVRTLVGSQMPGDMISSHTYTETYSYRVLMDIILYAETSVTLVMRHLGHLYDNLYDLFNQNFAVSAQKKYCRIALGALYHPRCLVNEDFYCIVFVNRDEVEKCDPPFLNRFEKHLITIEDLVQVEHWEITHHLLNWITNLLPDRQNDHFLQIQHLFLGFNQDHMCSLVVDAYKELRRQQEQLLNEETIMNFCKEKLLQIASLDLALTLALRTNHIEENNALIQQYYNIHARTTFANLLYRNISKQIVYTYTQIYENIDYDHQTIDEIKLGNFKMESEVIKRIKTHYRSDDTKRLLLIRIDYRQEHKQLLSIKHILLNALNEHDQYHERYVWLIIHVERNMLSKATNDVLFDNWSINMIDDLNAKKIIGKEIITNPSYLQFVSKEICVQSDVEFMEMIERCLSKFSYDVKTKQNEMKINQRRKQIIDSLFDTNNDFSFQEFIEENLINLIEKFHRENFDWRQDLLSNHQTIAICRSFNDALQLTLRSFYDRYLFVLLAHLEKHGFIDSYLFYMQTNDELVKDIWLDCFNSTLEIIDQRILNLDKIDIQSIFDIHLPCALDEYMILTQIRTMYVKRREILMDSDEQDNELDEWLINQLNEKSIYKNQYVDGSLFANEHFFDHYLHDQLLCFLSEYNIHLSVDFVLLLINSNQKLDHLFRLKHLMINHEEFLRLLHIFEQGCQLVQEKDMCRICKEHFIITDDNQIKPNTLYYTLIMKKNQFFQLFTGDTDIKDEFKCSGDAFIENSIMNLIERILSPEIIEHVSSIEQLLTICSLISQDIFQLSDYRVDNLEKLRSFVSLIRCISSSTQNDSLLILKQTCALGLEAMFKSCQSIHDFIEQLFKRLESVQTTTDKESLQRTVTKLEVEFLKNWLANNKEKYIEILELIGQKKNNLWRYSGKLFSFILQKLKLVQKIQDSFGQLAEHDYTEFAEYLQNSNDQIQKLDRLFVDRIHLELMMNVDKENAVNILAEGYNYFEENLQSMSDFTLQDQQQRSRLQSISLLSWLKYYVHTYAFVLSNDLRPDILSNIDQFLTNDSSSFGSTIKLFIFKQLIHFSKETPMEICEIYLKRNVLWLEPIFARLRQIKNEVHEEIIMPTPLFDGRLEFVRVNKAFSEIDDINRVLALINECGQSQLLMYSVYLWFIQHYCHFCSIEAETDERLLTIVQNQLRQSFSTIFQPIGYKLIVSLCTNFNMNSYFSLQAKMPKEQLAHRLLALNIMALYLSTRGLPQSTYLSTLLFNNQRQMPISYVNHIQSVCLLGAVISDPIVTQMIDVRTRIQERLDTNRINRQNSFMYQCSQECRWMFYFEDCGVPNSRSHCPLCKKDIGAQQYGVLIPRNPPQIQMTIDQGFLAIAQYLDQFNRQVRLGYNNLIPADQSNLGEKSDHLNRSVSFRFIHMLTNAQLLVLFELDYLTINDFQRSMQITNPRHFHEHFEKDCQLLEQTCIDSDQCYIWLYKLINHMTTPALIKIGLLDTQVKVIEMEQAIEQNIIFPHIISFVDEVNEYRVAYANFIREKRDTQPNLTEYIEEIRENESIYPYLSFFNISRTFTIDHVNEFILKLQNLPFSDRLYPVTTFLMNNLDTYSNIQHLYSIIEFTNYLLQKYNHRIKRNDAVTKSLQECLNESKTMQTYYDQFIYAWYELNLTEVQYRCQRPKFNRPERRETFAHDTVIASFLLNTSKDASSILVLGIIQTLSKYQNDIINNFNRLLFNNERNIPNIHVQAVKAEHVFRFDGNELKKKLGTDGFIINFDYGKGGDIIYDFEAIEVYLRNLVSSLHLLDCDTLHMFNYQFELYTESSSLITQIRRRIRQQLLPANERIKLTKSLENMNNDGLIHFLGSLDHLFTYLCNVDENEDNTGCTLQTFIEQRIGHQACLNDKYFRQAPFSTISITHMIAFYELMEEIAFSKILREYVRTELRDAKLPDDVTFDDFVGQTYGSTKIPDILRTPMVWIGTLKRMLMRLMNASTIALDNSISLYLTRIDMWTGNITEDDLESIEVHESFQLQHTYILLCELEARERALRKIEPTTYTPHAIANVEDQKTNTRIRLTNTRNTAMKKTVLTRPTNQRNDEKLRV